MGVVELERSFKLILHLLFLWLVVERPKPALMILRDGGWDKNDTQRRATALGVYEAGGWRRSEASRYGMNAVVTYSHVTRYMLSAKSLFCVCAGFIAKPFFSQDSMGYVFLAHSIIVFAEFRSSLMWVVRP
ncbi:hypothetical protein AG1IA_05179 [Rhizoctonia solani AG-1 IA]|uniref:Uncharacterized protein n=1 Tax=Thanatephorus cucumeris (strain AG1-IA) TaxID=983506 RepID=L8WS60_THACA|nr:hypothetical protein AG1IA_05179 [Rhizoctonia solani AG-1 IA]